MTIHSYTVMLERVIVQPAGTPKDLHRVAYRTNFCAWFREQEQ
jgi:hypothetical protein